MNMHATKAEFWYGCIHNPFMFISVDDQMLEIYSWKLTEYSVTRREFWVAFSMARSASAGELHKSSNQTREISKRNSNICKSSTNYKYSQRGVHRWTANQYQFTEEWKFSGPGSALYLPAIPVLITISVTKHLESWKKHETEELAISITPRHCTTLCCPFTNKIKWRS